LAPLTRPSLSPLSFSPSLSFSLLSLSLFLPLLVFSLVSVPRKYQCFHETTLRFERQGRQAREKDTERAFGIFFLSLCWLARERQAETRREEERQGKEIKREEESESGCVRESGRTDHISFHPPLAHFDYPKERKKGAMKKRIKK
jgi:hypothetical protein